MRLELALAWRNVWRNPRRTGLTVAATVFAVVLVVFFVAMAAGVHEKMIEDAVRIHSGHLTIAHQGYLESRTLEDFVPLADGLLERIRSAPGVRGAAPRVVGFGLLSRDAATQGVLVLGVDPRREASVTTLPGRVREGRFVASGPVREIVLGRRLAEKLGAGIGDQVLLYSVAYSLESAYDLFRVVGIARLPEPQLDRSLALIPLAEAQEFFVFPGKVSEIAVLAESADAVPQVERTLRRVLASSGDADLEIYRWDQVVPEVAHFVRLDDAGMYILLAILVLIVGFGILNTILMSVLERQREFGVLLAVGFAPRALFRLVYLESMLLAGIGLAVGLAIGVVLVLYFVAHPVPLHGEAAGAMELWGIEPVITWKLKPLNPIGSTLTVLGVAALAALYPALRASRERPVDALRSL